jgi:hypothetical protein
VALSSTKRGSKRSPADNYPTPGWVVHRLLDEVALPFGRWLEPGVGNGDIVKAVLKRRSDVEFTGFDIRNTPFIKKQAAPGNYFVGNLLKPEGRLADALFGPKFDVSIGNPPFWLAAQFIDFALKHSKVVVYLLRLNYLGSDMRADFMRSLAPDVFVLPNRPSFRPSKRGLLTTDSIEYAWFKWEDESERNRSEGTIKVLKTTSKEERRGR